MTFASRGGDRRLLSLDPRGGAASVFPPGNVWNCRSSVQRAITSGQSYGVWLVSGAPPPPKRGAQDSFSGVDTGATPIDPQSADPAPSPAAASAIVRPAWTTWC